MPTWGWINSYYTFTFAGYKDPARLWASARCASSMGIESRRDNENWGPCPRDMEILTYVLEGGLAHRDSMGEVHTFDAEHGEGDVCGYGVIHSEFNASEREGGHFLQIWIQATRSRTPNLLIKQISYDPLEKRGRFRLSRCSPGKRPQRGGGDSPGRAYIYTSVLDSGEDLGQKLAPGRHAWVQVAREICRSIGKRSRRAVEAAVGNQAGPFRSPEAPTAASFCTSTSRESPRTSILWLHQFPHRSDGKTGSGGRSGRRSGQIPHSIALAARRG